MKRKGCQRSLFHQAHRGKAMWGHGKKTAICNHVERSHQKPTLLAPWSWTSRIQDCEEITFCCIRPPVCVNLLWQPRQTNTSTSLQLLMNYGSGQWSPMADTTKERTRQTHLLMVPPRKLSRQNKQKNPQNNWSLLDLTSNLQEIPGTEEHVNQHQKDVISKTHSVGNLTRFFPCKKLQGK